MNLTEIGAKAKEVSRLLGKLGQNEKNAGLLAAADALMACQEQILAANGEDVDAARKKGMPRPA